MGGRKEVLAGYDDALDTAGRENVNIGLLYTYQCQKVLTRLEELHQI